MKPDRERLRDLVTITESDLHALRLLVQRLDEWVPRGVPIEVGSSKTYAAAMLLHNAYNALENLFRQTLRVFGETLPETERWHRLLLQQALTITPDRPAIFDSSLQPVLEELLRFRHRIRHSYDYDLDAERVGELIERWRSEEGDILAAVERFRLAMLRLSEASDP